MNGADTDNTILRETLRDFLGTVSDTGTVLTLMATEPGYSSKSWRTMADELGLQGIGIPERFGGAGGLSELAVVAEEAGRHLLCGPLLSGMLAAAAVEAGGDETAMAELLPPLAAGDLVATVALLPGAAFSAEAGPAGWRVWGACAQLVDGATADVVIVPANVADTRALFAVRTEAAGVSREALPTIDQTRRQARLVLADAPARLVAEPGSADAVMELVGDLAALLIGAECVGGAERSLQLAVEHARTRVQFGRPIGSFQAVKQACADMLLEVEAARSLLRFAIALAEAGDPAAPAAASAVAAACPAAFRRTAALAIQVLGGIGITWEHPAHLYLKRAKSNELMFGNAARHRARLAARGPELLLERLSVDPPTPGATEPEDPAREEVLARIAAFLADAPDVRLDDGRAFRAAQFDAGLAWIDHPVGRGGLGLPQHLQADVDAAMARAGSLRAHLRNPIGYGNTAAVLVAHGTEEQRARFLRPCFSLEEIWCQLMSEPGAGSDVAGLATRAVRDGAGWRISGQKVWTSLAHIARWGLLVARTDPDVPKHEGITCFVVDMTDPGVTVRPIRMINGKADFNEVFLDDVVVPDSARIGPVGQGWTVVRSNLEAERSAFGGGSDRKLPAAHMLDRWMRDPVDVRARTADRVMGVLVRSLAARLTAIRAATDKDVHPAAVKVLATEAGQAATETELDLAGPAGALHSADGYDFEQPTRVGLADGNAGARYLRSQALTIEGGTSMVMRNTLADRALGLPREPRADLGVPWRDIPRTVASARQGPR